MLNPYFRDIASDITVYCGDSREVLPQLILPDSYALVTDPTWPNATADLFGKDDPEGMFREILQALPHLPKRLAVHLGCDSDPRFLRSVPDEVPFFRTAHLEYARVGYKGRLLMTGDTAYLFGVPPKSRKGARVIPGRFTDPDSNGKQSNHPCPRKIGHVGWLLRWWTEPGELVLDPSGGSGTTAVVAKMRGQPCIMIEIDPDYCDEAARRVEAVEPDLFANIDLSGLTTSVRRIP